MNASPTSPFGSSLLDKSAAHPGNVDLSIFEKARPKVSQGAVSNDYLARCREEDPWPVECQPAPPAAAPVAPPETEEETKTVTTLVLSVFTDGTMNDADADAESGCQSNVAKLFTLIHQGEENGIRHEAKYVVGIGGGHRTDPSAPWIGRKLDGIADGAQQAVEGFSGLGFADRIDQAMSWISSLAQDHPEAKIQVQLFGFSRGAAEAIHLINVLCDPAELARYKMPDRSVVVTFAGLFDPVASIGFPGNGWDPGARLELSADMAKVVVSLVAQNEVRSLFDLLSLRIPPNGKRGPVSWSPTQWLEKRGNGPLPSKTWEEWVLPGVHSDVGGGYGPEEWIPDVTFQSDGNNPTTIRRGDAPGSAWMPLPDAGETLEDYVYRMKDREMEYGAALRGATSNEFLTKSAVEARIASVYEWKMERWRQKRIEDAAGNHSMAMGDFFREHPMRPGIRSRDNSLSRISLWVMIHRAEAAGVVWKNWCGLEPKFRTQIEPLSASHPLHYLQKLTRHPHMIEQEFQFPNNPRFWQRIVPHIHDSRLTSDLTQRVREVYFCGKA